MSATLRMISLLVLVGCALAFAEELEVRSVLSSGNITPRLLKSQRLAIEKTEVSNKATITILGGTDMPAGNVLTFARAEAARAIDSGVSDDQAAKYLSEIFTETFVPSPATAKWEAIVGTSFSAYVTRQAGRTFHARVNQKTVMVYQTVR